MPGESSGWACEVPKEPRDNVQVSKIDFFDMTTPFEWTYVQGTDYVRVVACARDSLSVTLIADVPPTDRESAGALRPPVRKCRRSDPGRALPSRGMRPTRDRKTEQLSCRDLRQSGDRE
jgi:hypothetical protein